MMNILHGKPFIGYDYFNANNFIRCYKCCGDHHTAKNCRFNILISSLCDQNQPINDCSKYRNNYCINCHTFKSTDKPVFMHHTTMSNNCYVH